MGKVYKDLETLRERIIINCSIQSSKTTTTTTFTQIPFYIFIMQFTLFLSTLLVAAAGVSAAPAEVQFTKRAESVPVDIYNGGICTGTIASTTYLPTDGLCFPLYAILSGNTNSVKIPAGALPAGCTGE